MKNGITNLTIDIRLDNVKRIKAKRGYKRVIGFDGLATITKDGVTSIFRGEFTDTEYFLLDKNSKQFVNIGAKERLDAYWINLGEIYRINWATYLQMIKGIE